MKLTRLLTAGLLAGSLFASLAGGVGAAANSANACLVGQFVSTSAGPGFGQETVALVRAGVFDPAAVATTSCQGR